MINDKSLEKAIKRETKNGLTIYHNGNEIWFLGTGWVAKTTEEQMRKELRGTLGSFVEMVGHMPEPGTIAIYKTPDGYMEQAEMAETAANTLSNYCGMIREILERTPLHFRGRPMYQTQGNGMYAEAVTPPAIAARETILNEKGCMVRRSETSEDYVIVQAYRPECVEDDPDWSYLEQRLWVDFGQEEAYGEEEEQMEMEEEDE